jgi:hypothetical protein
MRIYSIITCAVIFVNCAVIGCTKEQRPSNQKITEFSDGARSTTADQSCNEQSISDDRDRHESLGAAPRTEKNSKQNLRERIRMDLSAEIIMFMEIQSEEVFSGKIREFPTILDRLLEKYGNDVLGVIVEMFGEISAVAEADSEIHSRIDQMERLIGQSLTRAISNGCIEDEVKLLNDILTKKGASGKIASHIVNQTYVAIGQSGDKELISRVFLNVCSASIKQDHHFSELAESAGASLGHEYALSLIPLDGRLGDYGTRTGISAIVQNWLVTDPIEASQFIKDAPDSAHRMIYIEEMVSYLARSGSIEEAKGWLEVLPEGSLNYLNANEAINESMEREKSKTQEIPEEQ